MKRYLMLYAFLIMALSLMAHEDRAYRLYLRDKDLQHTPFSVSRPEQFLSARSIERRKRQGLSVDVTDLPIAPAYLDSVSRTGLKSWGRANGTIPCW